MRVRDSTAELPRPGRLFIIVNFPGQRIGNLEQGKEAGKGTYTRNGFIVASLAGFVQSTQKESGMVPKYVVRGIGYLFVIYMNCWHPSAS